LSVRTVQGVVLVPNSAIQHNGATSFVYVVKNGSVQIRNVKAGISDSGVTVVDGLQPGEVIANSSFERLQPNSSVVIANNAPKQLTTESIDP
jgi:multidrug efflux system membrane fusion protein